MASIQVNDGAPGILGPMATGPESTQALRELVELLLRGTQHAHAVGTGNNRDVRFFAERLLFLPTFARRLKT
jgi:hypothetical protein